MEVSTSHADGKHFQQEWADAMNAARRGNNHPRGRGGKQPAAKKPKLSPPSDLPPPNCSVRFPHSSPTSSRRPADVMAALQEYGRVSHLSISVDEIYATFKHQEAVQRLVSNPRPLEQWLFPLSPNPGAAVADLKVLFPEVCPPTEQPPAARRTIPGLTLAPHPAGEGHAVTLIIYGPEGQHITDVSDLQKEGVDLLKSYGINRRLVQTPQELTTLYVFLENGMQLRGSPTSCYTVRAGP